MYDSQKNELSKSPRREEHNVRNWPSSGGRRRSHSFDGQTSSCRLIKMVDGVWKCHHNLDGAQENGATVHMLEDMQTHVTSSETLSKAKTSCNEPAFRYYQHDEYTAAPKSESPEPMTSASQKVSSFSYTNKPSLKTAKYPSQAGIALKDQSRKHRYEETFTKLQPYPSGYAIVLKQNHIMRETIESVNEQLQASRVACQCMPLLNILACQQSQLPVQTVNDQLSNTMTTALPHVPLGECPLASNCLAMSLPAVMQSPDRLAPVCTLDRTSLGLGHGF